MCQGFTALMLAVCAVPAVAQVEKALELQRQGKAQEALAILEREIPQLRTKSDPAQLARALSAAGEAYTSSGQYQKALQVNKEALDLHVSLRDGQGQARDWNALGLADMYLGNYARSLDEFQRALTLDRSNGDREGEVALLNNLGNDYYFLGRYLDALQAFWSAREKLNASPGASWYARRRQITMANLATLYQRIGAEEKALALYSEFSGNASAMRPSERAQMQLNEGVLYRRLGDPVKALAMYRSAQTLFAKDQHRDGEIGAWRNIGIALGLDMQDLPGALAAFQSALNLARQAKSNRGEAQAELYRGEILRRMGRWSDAEEALGPALENAQRAGLVEEQWKALYAIGLLAEARGDPVRAEECFTKAIRLIETVRAGLQLASLRTDFLADKRDVYDALIGLRLNAEPLPVADLFHLMERSHARTLQDRVSSGSGQPISLAAVQSQLDPATLLVEYWIGAQSAAALWISRNNAGVVKQQLTPELSAGIEAFAGELSQGAGEWRRHASDIGKQLLTGIPLGAARHLIVIPDEVLQILPFETLESPGRHNLLIERMDVSYLATAALTLNRQSRKRGWLFPWRRQLLAIGDPVGAKESSGTEVLEDGEQWQSLPHAAEEVRAIANTLDGRVEQHIGPDARKIYLTSRASDPAPLVHLSTHAAADMQDPERSRILLAPAKPYGPFDYLFLREIYGLDLRGVDLVTASACDTERGKLVRGEGAQGFSRAFLAAGAAASVTSLWRIADSSTTEFMKQFYFALSRGQSKAEALRTAKLRFLRSGSKLEHPRYWAAFVLSGDGQSPIDRVIPWSGIGGTLGAILMGITLAMSRHRGKRLGTHPSH